MTLRESYYFGLADPTVAIDRARARRFAQLYTGDTPMRQTGMQRTG